MFTIVLKINADVSREEIYLAVEDVLAERFSLELNKESGTYIESKFGKPLHDYDCWYPEDYEDFCLFSDEQDI